MRVDIETLRECVREILTQGYHAEDVVDLFAEELRKGGYSESLIKGAIFAAKVDARGNWPPEQPDAAYIDGFLERFFGRSITGQQKD